MFHGVSGTKKIETISYTYFISILVISEVKSTDGHILPIILSFYAFRARNEPKLVTLPSVYKTFMTFTEYISGLLRLIKL